MDLPLFYQYGRKLEQHFEARGVRPNSRMGQIQRELNERSQAADGIQPFGAFEQNSGSNSNLQLGRRALQAQINPFGHSLDDINQQRLQQQMQQQMVLQMQQVRLQQMMQQQMAQQQVMRQQQIQQQHIWQKQMQQQMMQQQLQPQQFMNNQKVPIVTVEEMAEGAGEAEEEEVL